MTIPQGDWESLREALLAQGFGIQRRTGNGCWWVALPPNKVFSPVHWTEASRQDPKVFRNILAILRRSGFEDRESAEKNPGVTVNRHGQRPEAEIRQEEETPMSATKVTVIDRRHTSPDDAFEKLKESRQLTLMAREMRDRAETERTNAEKNFQAAQRELESAEKDLLKAKREFDALFVVTEVGK